MRSLTVPIALLALFVCSTTAIELEGCQRGYLSVMTADKDKHLRKEIKEKLGFSTNRDDVIAQVTVRSRDRAQTMTATFVGRNKDGLSIAYEFEVRTDRNSDLTVIPFKTFFDYLQCEQIYFKPNPPKQDEHAPKDPDCCA
ncbi:unnamed protein product [Heligmosomoides polygyrus]|uniref:Cystatin domain-containing protein n=1 Tax=Heligmosomoides polygyrus TaxID=6339 RepID=A0A183G7K2_HELPZ|nr:unnamed protein product [Heligmosomoides polygyrus]